MPPKVSFYYRHTPYVDISRYHVYMGQSLEAVVNASDNFQVRWTENSVGEKGMEVDRREVKAFWWRH